MIHNTSRAIAKGRTARRTLVLGRVLRYHVREGLIRPTGMVDALLLKPLARLSGDEYATIGSVFLMARPSS